MCLPSGRDGEVLRSLWPRLRGAREPEHIPVGAPADVCRDDPVEDARPEISPKEQEPAVRRQRANVHVRQDTRVTPVLEQRGDVPAVDLRGASANTWRNPGGRFPPGRLDWVLHSDSSLEVMRAFIFDTAVISPYWLAQHGLWAADSVTTSDHLPIVVDVRWRR